MAVTIDEMHVEVQGAPPPGQSSGANEEPKNDVDLATALAIMQERKLRLRAD
jgi:hypothetical protein